MPRRGVVCNICRCPSRAFKGPAHSESAVCGGCGAITRDRFLHHCAHWERSWKRGTRVLETSPRLGEPYRDAMASWYDYTSSDFDEGAHKGAVRLDLQAIDRPDDSFDLVLSPHVLEHVPDTDAALAELRRVIAPGGRLALQVPVLQGATAPPAEPEFHGDNTPVFWRFGFDLTERLGAAGFVTRLACLDDFLALAHRRLPAAEVSGEFDLNSMLDHAPFDELTPVASDTVALALGLAPAYQLLTWICD